MVISKESRSFLKISGGHGGLGPRLTGKEYRKELSGKEYRKELNSPERCASARLIRDSNIFKGLSPERCDSNRLTNESSPVSSKHLRRSSTSTVDRNVRKSMTPTDDRNSGKLRTPPVKHKNDLQNFRNKSSNSMDKSTNNSSRRGSIKIDENKLQSRSRGDKNVSMKEENRSNSNSEYQQNSKNSTKEPGRSQEASRSYKSSPQEAIRTDIRCEQGVGRTYSRGPMRSVSPATTILSRISADSGLVSDLDSQASLLEDSLNPELGFSYQENSLPEEVDSLEATLYENTVESDLYENTVESNVYENWSHNLKNEHQESKEYKCPTPPPPPAFRDPVSVAFPSLEMRDLPRFRVGEEETPRPLTNTLSSNRVAEEEMSSINIMTLKKRNVTLHQFNKYFAEESRRKSYKHYEKQSDQYRHQISGEESPNFGNHKENCNFDHLEQDCNVDNVYLNDERFNEDFKTMGRSIRSSRGTVRGMKNLVKSGIANFLLDQSIKDKRDKENGRLIVYVSSCGIIRETRARCTNVCKILRNLMIRYEERDVFVSRDHLLDLKDRLGIPPPLPLPLVFIHGNLLGDSGAIERLNESGEFKNIVNVFKDPEAWLNTCGKCGGYCVVPCHMCSGSKKSSYKSFPARTQIVLRCTACDEGGLVKCDMCT